MTAQDVIDSLSQEHDVSQFRTTEDVETTLRACGKKGTNLDLKREVVTMLFPQTSPQGFHTVDDIENYREY